MLFSYRLKISKLLHRTVSDVIKCCNNPELSAVAVFGLRDFFLKGRFMFDLKSKVVYPGHGVAVIDELFERTVAGSTVTFMKLAFLFKDMTILVPTYNVDAIGIRQPSSLDNVNIAVAELFNKPDRRLESIDFTPSGWNKRHKDYQNKIQSGSLFEIAKIYRDLMYVAQQKDLSFGERALLQTTEELLAQEIQVVRGLSREFILQEIRTPFKQLVFHDTNFLRAAETVSLS